ncbi:MAG: hypothetical protein ABIG28_00655 [archaeon]
MPDRLEILTQDEYGEIYREDGTLMQRGTPLGKLRTIRLDNPVVIPGNVINEKIQSGEIRRPRYANALLTSPFNPDTQFINKKAVSCYALQFYFCNARKRK